MDPQVCDLMRNSGRVLNLEGKQHSDALARQRADRETILLLVRVCRDDDTGVGNMCLSKQLQPFVVVELLRKLSNPDTSKTERPEDERRGAKRMSKTSLQITQQLKEF
ncbi:hypothetical protein FQN60_018652 [Etheostoma spectabile]|uniref:Uncharacterized protein n=1 Tax=Etheostoma spectabile TaxID=54343 RepID=A0A5J5CAP6_9PERO|nr:hypothetical protein FQN60_018652 [Etheostoma spectabile]